MNIEQWQKDQLGENILYYIKKSGYTLRWTAHESGVSNSGLQSWVYGKAVPNAIQLKAVANVLGVTVDMLLAGVTVIPVNCDDVGPLGM